jgi:hypothetical protein
MARQAPQHLQKMMRRVRWQRRPVVVGVVLLAALVPAAATPLRPDTPPTLLRAESLGRATQGGQSITSGHHAVLARKGRLEKAVRLTKPAELHLRKAHGAVFDVRALKGTVVKRERAEHPAPGQTAEESDPATSLPATIDPKAISSSDEPAPAPDANFEGLDFATWGAGHPPDTNGDVGPTYYIQTINSSIGIYDKSNGNRVAAFTFNAFMSQGNFGNVCDASNFGDPVVLYDSFEDRWFVTDFAFTRDGLGNISPQHVFQCFAVSKTGDPVAGGWNFYSIEAPGGIDDYPKFGVWPDGIYMSANMFGYGAGSSFIAPHVWAIDKAQMYAGEPSVQVADFAAPLSDFTLLPGNARLQAGTPPLGTPEYFVSTWQFLNAVTVYKLHVDWDKISTSTFTGPQVILNATAWPNAAVGNAASPGNNLDTLQIRAMAELQYSNIHGSESLWATHTVRRENTTGFAAPRWYQLNVTGGAVAANTVQGTTWDPDAANAFYRFMPSLAVDRMGDMALGYSKSNSTTNPQIKYAGRLAGDPVNTFSQEEQTLIDGTGTQTGNCGGALCIRWGDYSGMALDPDGCTFWETNEYYTVDGLDDHTRIGSFRFPGCATVGDGTLSGTVTDGTDPIAGASVSLGSRTTTTDGSGNYAFSVPAGTYPSLTASKAGFDSSSATGVVVPDGGTATRDFTLGPAATSGCFVDNTQSSFQRGIPNGCDLTSSPGAVKLTENVFIDQQNTSVTTGGFAFNSTSWGGQTFTPAVTAPVTRIDLDLFCSGCTGSTPDITVSIRATSGGVPTGADLATATIAGFSGPSGYYSALFAAPATLTAGTRYAVVFRSVSNPSAGTYAYFASNTNPYANGQRVVSGNSGSTWAADPTSGGRDLGFKVWVNTGFTPSGTFVSSVKDANPASGHTPMWTTLSFAAATPASTNVKFQVAGSDHSYGPFSFVGPDGTAGTFFTTSGASVSQFNGLRYLRYKAYLSSSDNSVSPTVSEVALCFTNRATNLTVEPASGTYGGTTTLSATLTHGGAGLGGKSIDFTLHGNLVGSATTDANGVATLNGAGLSGIDAGSYPTGVGASFGGDAGFDPSAASNSLTVDVKPLTITADDRSKLFGQTLLLGTTAFTTSGLVSGDGIAGVTLTSAGAAGGAAVGTYPIVASDAVGAAGTNLDNYSIGYVDGTLTVTLAGIVGLESVTVNGDNSLIDSFDSSAGAYGPGNMGTAVSLLSNGVVTLGGATVHGDVRSTQASVVLKDSALVTGDVTAGTTIKNGGTINGTATPNSPAALMTPAPVPDCSPFGAVSGIGGKSSYNPAKGDLTVKSSVTLADGTYCFHNVTLSGGGMLRVTGPVTIKLTGELDVGGSSNLVNATSVPANLKISSSFVGGTGVDLSGVDAYVSIYAPRTGITLSGQSTVFGSLLGRALSVSGDSAVHFDVR